MNVRMVAMLLFFLGCKATQAQYSFTVDKEIKNTPIKNQQNTGTCWSFATCSYLESELLHQNNLENDLSEMFVVRNIYIDKAKNYVLRQGKANFSQGSLSHDFVRVIGQKGIVPESVYSGKTSGDKVHNHTELVAVLKGMLDAVIKQKRPSDKWEDALESVLDVYLGKVPERFEENGVSYTPMRYAASLGLDPTNYLSITSFTHHPYFEKFILEIPDNYSNQSYYNLPFETLERLVDRSIDLGYSIAWDGDVSEPGFSAEAGIAILPEDPKRKDLFTVIGREMDFSVQKRQQAFENYSTTDDHLMHIVGIAHDQAGNKYYKIKNSWGERGTHRGYLFMSEAYFKMKTISVMLNKKVLPTDIAQRLKL